MGRITEQQHTHTRDKTNYSFNWKLNILVINLGPEVVIFRGNNKSQNALLMLPCEQFFNL